MSQIEYQLLTKVLQTQEFHLIQKLNITQDYFYSPECRELFSYIQTHFQSRQTYGKVPSLQLTQGVHPSFPYMESADAIETLCEQLRLNKIHMELMEVSGTLVQLAGTNPREGLDWLKRQTARMSSSHEDNNDTTLGAEFNALCNNYHTVAVGKGLTGIPWPWEILNMETQGIHKGEFVILYGRPKSMKTWCALYIAMYANQWANARVLVYSLEMSKDQVVRRAASLFTRVNYKSFKSGKLTEQEYWRVFNALKELEHQHRDPTKHNTFHICEVSGNAGVSFLHAKIREFKPDLVVVDGMYLMRDDRQKTKVMDWKAISHISQDLKRTAIEFKIPVIGTTQANRKAEKNPKHADLSGISYSDSFAQDCDLAIQVHRQLSPKNGMQEIVLGIPAMREGNLEAFMIHGMPSVSFDFKSAEVEFNKNPEESHAPPVKKDNTETPVKTVNKYGSPDRG